MKAVKSFWTLHFPVTNGPGTILDCHVVVLRIFTTSFVGKAGGTATERRQQKSHGATADTTGGHWRALGGDGAAMFLGGKTTVRTTISWNLSTPITTPSLPSTNTNTIKHTNSSWARGLGSCLLGCSVDRNQKIFSISSWETSCTFSVSNEYWQ